MDGRGGGGWDCRGRGKEDIDGHLGGEGRLVPN